jgi:hypothetical protein
MHGDEHYFSVCHPRCRGPVSVKSSRRRGSHGAGHPTARLAPAAAGLPGRSAGDELRMTGRVSNHRHPFKVSVQAMRALAALVLLAAISVSVSADSCAGKPPGTLRWFFNTSTSNLGDPSLIADGAVFFAADSWFYALEIDTGLPRWSFKFPGNYSIREKMPSTLNGLVFVYDSWVPRY